MKTTSVLLKIFARGFYRAHAGLLLVAFVSVIVYAFFINVLEENHITREEALQSHLGVVLGMLSSPVALLFVLCLWTVLITKSWSYVLQQVALDQHQFLRYSFTALPAHRRLATWFLVQLAISAPMLLYGVFALVIGIIFGSYKIAVAILLFVVLLSFISALIYSYAINRTIRDISSGGATRFLKRLPKPMSAIPFYGLVSHNTVSLIFTKLLSVAMILADGWLYRDLDDGRTSGFTALAIGTTHGLLVWQLGAFEEVYMQFQRNFPLSLATRFSQKILGFSVLIVFESIWLVVAYGPIGLVASLFCLGVIVLCYAVRLRIATNMRTYIYLIFLLFSTMFIAVLFHAMIFAAPLLLVLGFIVFHNDFRRIEARA